MVGSIPLYMDNILHSRLLALNEKGANEFNHMTCPGPPNPSYVTGELVVSEFKFLFQKLVCYPSAVEQLMMNDVGVSVF